MSRKGVGLDAQVDVKIVNKETGKTYNYSYSGGSRTGQNIMAWHIQQTIIKENRLKTRYDYSGFMEKRISAVISRAMALWFEELGVSILADVETIIVKEL